jgi:hypothetical protein
MTARQATDLVLRILAIAECPKDNRMQLQAFLELCMSGGAQPKQAPRVVKVQEDANDLKPEENTISLADAFHFDFPKEFNLQVEGQEGTRKIKIFPDGVSESEPAPKTEA